MALLHQFESKHLVLALVLSAFAVVLIGVVAREIFYAANPDKRPRKRRRRR